MSDEKRLAELLDTYLDDPERGSSALEPPDRETVESLRQLAAREHPRPGFVNELAQQLRRKDRKMNETPKLPFVQRLLRMAVGGVALAGFLAIVLYAAGLFRTPILEPSVEEMETPVSPEVKEIIEPNEGPFAGHRLQIATTLGDEAGEAPLHRIAAAGLPDTIEGALELGRALGLEDPEVFETSNQPGAWVVRDESGRSVSFPVGGSPRGGMPGGLYYTGNDGQAFAAGDPMPFDEAARVAVEFLSAANLLPEAYDVSEEVTGGDIGARLVNITPLIEGRPLEGPLAINQVAVLADGNIAFARIFPLTVTPMDDVVVVKSARQAWDDLLQGAGGYGFSYENVMPEDQRQRIFYPEVAPPGLGERVTVSGWANVLTALSNGHVRVRLHGASRGVIYELTGPAVAELADAGGGYVQIEGAIVEVQPQGARVLEAESWQASTPPTGPSYCETGVIARDGERGFLQTDNGERYDLGAVDPDLAGGLRVEVCAESFSVDEAVNWQHIVTPPRAELSASGGGAGSGGASISAVQAVEVTRVVTEIGSEGVEVQESSQPPIPAPGGDENSALAITIGEEITVTGSVGGYLRREGGELVPYLVLGIDADGDPFTPAGYYPLYGDRERLLELSDYNRQYVTVQGTVVEATAEMRGPNNQAILVASFQPLPGPGLQSLLGRVERQTLEGREVTVLVDATSDARYVLFPGMHMDGIDGAVWIAGVVHPTAEVGGLPVLEAHSSRSGSDVDAADSPDDFPMDEGLAEIQVVEATPRPAAGSGLPETMIIERATLGYHYEPRNSTAEEHPMPTWFFHGRSPDGLTTFVLQARAVDG